MSTLDRRTNHHLPPRGSKGGFAALTGLFLAFAIMNGSNAAAGSVFVRGNGTEVETLDPHKVTGVPENRIQRDLFEGLLIDAADGSAVPGVAESWDISEDGTVYTFHLRPEALWSNGDPVTAHDFVYSYRRMADPATAAPYVSLLFPIKNMRKIVEGHSSDLSILGVKALDDHTLQMTLEEPTPYFLGMLTHQTSLPVHRPSVEEHGNAWVRPGNMVSNGPFVLKEWRPQAYIKVAKNPLFREADKVRLDEVIFYPTEDINAELRRYRAGELDLTATLPLEKVRWARENLSDELQIVPYLGIYFYAINMTDPRFHDRRIRRALNLAVNREIITEKVTRSGEVPAYGWVPPGTTGYEAAIADWYEQPYPERLREARELMAAAGYGPGNPLEVEILYNTQDDHKRIAVAIASMWKQIGVKATMRNEEWKVYLASGRSRNYEISRAAWIGDYNDAYTFLELVRGDFGVVNRTAWNDPEYMRILDLAKTELDMAKRAKLMHEAEQYLLSELPAVPIYFYVSRHLVKPYVKGFVSNLVDRHASRWIWIDHDEKAGPIASSGD